MHFSAHKQTKIYSAIKICWGSQVHHRRKLERGAYLHKHRRVPHIEMLPPKYASSAPRPTVGIWQPRALALLEVGVTAERVNLNTAALLVVWRFHVRRLDQWSAAMPNGTVTNTALKSFPIFLYPSQSLSITPPLHPPTIHREPFVERNRHPGYLLQCSPAECCL